MLPAILVETLVARLIGPSVDSQTVLLVFLPEPTVDGPVRMHVLPIAVSLVVGPLPLVDVAVCVNELAETVGFVVAPVADVLGAVRPLLGAEAIPEIALPLA